MTSQHKNIKAVCALASTPFSLQDILVRVAQKKIRIKYVLAKFQSWDWIVMDTNMQIVQHYLNNWLC